MKLLLAIPLAGAMVAANGQELKLPTGVDCEFRWDENPPAQLIESYEIAWSGPRPQGGTYTATVAQATCQEVGIDTSRPARYTAAVRATNATGTSKNSEPVHFRFVGEAGRPPTRPTGFIVLPKFE